MAGISVSKAQWDALLMEDYVLDGMTEAVNKSTVFKKNLKRVGMTHGRRRIYPVQVGMSQGNGARGELEEMPEAGAEEWVDAQVVAKYNYATFKASGPSMVFSTRKAWVDFADRGLTGTKEGLTQDLGRQCWSDGSGKMGRANGQHLAGLSSISITAAFGVSWGSLATKTTFLIKKNMYIAFDTEDNNGQGYKVTQVTATAIQISPPLLSTIADQTAIYKKKAKGKEITGFLAFVGTASFMSSVLQLSSTIYNGIDRALYDAWEGNVLNASGSSLTLALVRQLKDMLYTRIDDEDSNLCVNSTQVTSAYEALLTPAQRFQPAVKLDGGFTALSHDGLKLTRDSKAPVGSFQALNTKFIAWAQTGDPAWDDDGSGPLHRVSGQDAREALLKWYSEIDCEEPRRQGIMYNIGGLS